MFTITLIILLLLIIIFAYVYVLIKLNYWNRRGVPNLKPKTPLGDLIDCFIGKKNIYELIKERGYEFKNNGGHRFFGFYLTIYPIFVPIDYELIKLMLNRDHDYFPDRGLYVDKKKVPFGLNLFSADADKWKYLRNLTSNGLSPSKMKSFLPIVEVQAKKCVKTIAKANGKPIDIFDLSIRYVLDVVSDALYGIEQNNLDDEMSPLLRCVKNLIGVKLKNLLAVSLMHGLKNPGRILQAFFVDNEVTGFFLDFTKKLYDLRKRNNIKRNDLFNVYMTAYESNDADFDLFDLTSQIIITYIAAFETTSRTITYNMYQIGKMQKLQTKLRDEFIAKRAKNDGDIDIDTLMELDYLERFTTESVRLHTVAGMLNRNCVKDYKIPNSDVIIEKGTPVIIPVLSIHHDPDYFPNPDEFDPDRFLDVNQKQRMMNFGIGHHYCLGKYLAKAIVKKLIAEVLLHYNVKINEELTGNKLEQATFARHVTISYKNTIWLEFSPISSNNNNNPIKGNSEA